MADPKQAKTTVEFAAPVAMSIPLTVLFVVVRLMGGLDWPWMWVLSPLWIAAAFTALIMGIVLVITAVKR